MTEQYHDVEVTLPGRVRATLHIPRLEVAYWLYAVGTLSRRELRERCPGDNIDQDILARYLKLVSVNKLAREED